MVVAVHVEKLFSYQTAKMRLSLGWVVFCISCAAIRKLLCGEVNVWTTNKSNRAAGAGRGRPIFDVNTKLAAGRYIYLISSFYLNIFPSFLII